MSDRIELIHWVSQILTSLPHLMLILHWDLRIGPCYNHTIFLFWKLLHNYSNLKAKGFRNIIFKNLELRYLYNLSKWNIEKRYVFDILFSEAKWIIEKISAYLVLLDLISHFFTSSMVNCLSKIISLHDNFH
jgi:hypothetical protein